MGNITLYKWTDENGQPKSLRILDEISSRWTEAGDLLGLCPARLEGIEEHRLRNARSCCRDVLHDWIQDNQGSYPVSWEGLICLLKDMELTVLAKEVQCELSTFAFIALHSLGFLMPDCSSIIEKEDTISGRLLVKIT